MFTWVLQELSTAGLVKGKTISIDATTLEGNAALRGLVRHDTGEGDGECRMKSARASGIEHGCARTWRESIGSEVRRARAPIGPIRTIPMRESRR